MQLQWFGDDDLLFIAKEESILPFDYGHITRSEHGRIAYLPITVEYMLFDKSKINFSFGAGFGLSFYEFTDLETRTLRIGSQDVPKQIMHIANQTNNKNPFYTSVHIEANVYFKTKGFLLKANIIYNKSFKPYRTGDYEFLNLELSPNTKGKFEQSGDFLGVGLTVYLKKQKKR